jgi:hypothetical protein
LKNTATELLPWQTISFRAGGVFCLVVGWMDTLKIRERESILTRVPKSYLLLALKELREREAEIPKGVEMTPSLPR